VKKTEKKLPLTLVAELTYSCNHSCIFCSCPWENDKDLKSKEISTEEWKEIIDKCVFLGVRHITFTGGEPTLREDLFELITHAKKRNLDIGLITNGKNVGRGFLEKLSKYDVSINISIPGIKTFFDLTGHNGLEHVLNLFNICKELNIKSVANITVTKKNLFELYENIAMPLLNGAEYILLNRFLPGGRGLKYQEFLLNIEEINQMLFIAEEVLRKAGAKGHIGTELPYCIIENPDSFKHLAVGSLCSGAKHMAVIDPSGFVKVCNHSPVRVCHYSKLDDILKQDYWMKYLKSHYIPKMCIDCEHLHTKCDGGCREAAYIVHGSIDASDPCFECKIKKD